MLDDDVNLRGPEANLAVGAIWSRLAPLGLRGPHLGGVFLQPTSARELCDGPRGIVDEAVGPFGRRMQLLLEARAVVGTPECTRLQRRILQRYAQHPYAGQTGQRWGYLRDDLIRYWRSYRVWRHWDVAADNGGWYLRNAKLGHSRLLTYASFLLSTFDREDEPTVEALLNVLPLTPLERILQIDESERASVFHDICRHYERFLSVVNDAEQRRQLEDVVATTPEQLLATAPEVFGEILSNADGLRLACCRLLLQRPSVAMERLLANVVF